MESGKGKRNLIVDTCVECNSIITRFEEQVPMCEVCRFLEVQKLAFNYPTYIVDDCQMADCKN